MKQLKFYLFIIQPLLYYIFILCTYILAGLTFIIPVFNNPAHCRYPEREVRTEKQICTYKKNRVLMFLHYSILLFYSCKLSSSLFETFWLISTLSHFKFHILPHWWSSCFQPVQSEVRFRSILNRKLRNVLSESLNLFRKQQNVIE